MSQVTNLSQCRIAATPSRRAVLAGAAATLLSATLVRPVRAASADPESAVRALVADLGALAREAGGMPAAARLDAVSDLIRRYFDLGRIAENTIGARRFRGLSKEQQATFTDAYTRFTVASYTKRLPSFDDQAFEIVGVQEGPPGLKAVRAKYRAADGENALLDFILGERDGVGWQIVDLRIDGAISELAVRRSEVSNVLDDKGFDGLIALLRDRTEKLSGEA